MELLISLISVRHVNYIFIVNNQKISIKIKLSKDNKVLVLGETIVLFLLKQFYKPGNASQPQI